MRHVLVCFLEEIEDIKKVFWNILTFTYAGAMEGTEMISALEIKNAW